MSNNKILYFIHVPWKWIKQRPHFIAEELSCNNEVVVAETLPINARYRSRGKQTINLRSYLQLPKDRFPVIHYINKLLQKIQLRKYIQKADLFWFTNPYQYSFFKRKDLKGRIVYDCMDDLAEFEPTEGRRQKLVTAEKRLYQEADIVIASSFYLREKLYKRYGNRDVVVVNNAIKRMENVEIKPLPEEVKDTMPTGKFIISYIGTIEKWIDFKLVNEIVEKCPEVAFCFFGPLKVELPKSDRVCYCGMVPHDLVFSVMENSDALIMPFELSELILSVNPVKLYEYIYSGKPCLAPHYGESEAFGEYAYLYESNLDCCEIIKSLIAGKGAKHTKEESKAFAMSNTWKERVEQIENLIG